MRPRPSPSHRLVPLWALLGALAASLVGCQSPVPSSVPAGTQSAGGTPATDGTAAPSASPETAVATPVPGFEDWQTLNPNGVRISVEDGALVLDLTRALLWFNDQRGVLFSRDVTGDFRAIATVRTSRASDPTKPPGADGTVQLAGLMARAQAPTENNLFIVTGSVGSATGLETKTTMNSQSIYVQRNVANEGDAELKVCRTGFTFLMLWRHAGSDEAWTRMSTFERRDMPETLQVGAAIYTDSRPDIVARFEGLKVEPLPAGGEC